MKTRTWSPILLSLAVGFSALTNAPAAHAASPDRAAALAVTVQAAKQTKLSPETIKKAIRTFVSNNQATIAQLSAAFNNDDIPVAEYIQGKISKKEYTQKGARSLKNIESLLNKLKKVPVPKGAEEFRNQYVKLCERAYQLLKKRHELIVKAANKEQLNAALSQISQEASKLTQDMIAFQKKYQTYFPEQIQQIQLHKLEEIQAVQLFIVNNLRTIDKLSQAFVNDDVPASEYLNGAISKDEYMQAGSESLREIRQVLDQLKSAPVPKGAQKFRNDFINIWERFYKLLERRYEILLNAETQEELEQAAVEIEKEVLKILREWEQLMKKYQAY